MEEISSDDFDSLLLQMDKMLEQKKKSSRQQKEYKLDMGVFIKIPNEFSIAKKEDAAVVFRSQERPSVIFLTKEKNEGITFQIMRAQKIKEPLDAYGEKIRNIIEQTDYRIVFYNTGTEGQTVRIHWFEYKSFAERERIYNLVFLFQAENKIILGTFYCLFKDYDRWKPVIFEMLNTIKTEEPANERL